MVQRKLSQNHVAYPPGQVSSLPIPSGPRAGLVLPIAPRTPPFKKRGQEVDKLVLQTKEHVTEVTKSEVSQGTLICWPKLKALPTSFRPWPTAAPVHTRCAADWL